MTVWLRTFQRTVLWTVTWTHEKSAYIIIGRKTSQSISEITDTKIRGIVCKNALSGILPKDFPDVKSRTVLVTVRWIVLRTFSIWRNSSRNALEIFCKILYFLGLLICLFPAFSFVEVLSIEKDFLSRIRNCD